MIITSLSPSMVITHGVCARRFFYSEVARLPYLPNPDAAFGGAFHKMARETHYQKINSGKDLPIDLLQDFFWEDLKYRDVDWSTKSFEKTADEGVISVKSYMQKVAPSIQPAHVEHAWTMKVTNRDWVISGITDLITDNNKVKELKTSKNRPDGYKSGKPKPKDDHRFQIGTYIAAWRMQTGLPDVQGELDYSIRGKDEIYSIPVTFGDDLSKGILDRFLNVAYWIEREEWMPNRYGTYLCSRRYCSYWNTCEQDCRGRVKD